MSNFSIDNKKVCKDTTIFLYMQACANIICKKMHFLPKNGILFAFCFRLSTIYINFARYFGLLWTLGKDEGRK